MHIGFQRVRTLQARLKAALVVGFDISGTPRLQRRLLLLYPFLTLSILLFSAFAFVQAFVWDHPLLALVDVLTAAASLTALVDLRLNRNLNRSAFVGSLALVGFFTVFIHQNHSDHSGLLWTTLTPYFFVALNGHRRGLHLALVFYAFVFTMAYQGIDVWEAGEWTQIDFVRLVIASCVLTFQVYMSERTVRRASHQVEAARAKDVVLLDQLKVQLSTDHLTGIQNRRSAQRAIETERLRAQRYGGTFCVMMLDVDHFKEVNDQYGHNVGDEVLKQFTATIQPLLRAPDMFARWGGEEFLVLLPETHLKNAILAAERFRRAVEATVFPHGSTLTMSVGVALNEPEQSYEWLIAQADGALYRAKAAGRNRVFAAPRTGETA
jgi:diguanylate cyclase (GGDEF)-like protein